MKKLLIKSSLLLLSLINLSQASVIEPGRSVLVEPLLFSYQVKQDFQNSYVKAESSIKGYAKEKNSNSYSANQSAGYYSASGSASAKNSIDGKYDLEKKAQYESSSYNDTVIVEKILVTEKYTGIIEAALSEAGINVVSRDSKGDYKLTGDVVSVRTGNVRLVPDGTGRRYSVGSTLRISIKITNERTNVSSFAKTFTGKGNKTFDADDYLPAEESMDIAMDDLVSQMVYALTGTRVPNPSESDDEYQDSPGKRLRD